MPTGVYNRNYKMYANRRTCDCGDIKDCTTCKRRHYSRLRLEARKDAEQSVIGNRPPKLTDAEWELYIIFGSKSW